MIHLIARIHWPRGVRPERYDDCPISCDCGWSGTVRDWNEHRGRTKGAEIRVARRAEGRAS